MLTVERKLAVGVDADNIINDFLSISEPRETNETTINIIFLLFCALYLYYFIN